MNRNYLAVVQEQKILDFKNGSAELIQFSAPQFADTDARTVMGLFLFTVDNELLSWASAK